MASVPALPLSSSVDHPFEGVKTQDPAARGGCICIVPWEKRLGGTGWSRWRLKTTRPGCSPSVSGVRLKKTRHWAAVGGSASGPIVKKPTSFSAQPFSQAFSFPVLLSHRLSLAVSARCESATDSVAFARRGCFARSSAAWRLGRRTTSPLVSSLPRLLGVSSAPLGSATLHHGGRRGERRARFSLIRHRRAAAAKGRGAQR